MGEPCRQNKVADAHVRRTGHFTALTVEAVLVCLVKKSSVLKAIALTVRP